MSNPLIRQLDSSANQVIIEADFPNLTPAQLFAAFTKAAQLTQWWPQKAETDPKLGGRYHLAWPMMNWHLRGTYTVFEPARVLQFTWQWDHQPNLAQRRVTLNIEPSAPGSQLKLEHGYYGEGAVEAEDRQNHLEGWFHFLGQLQNLSSETLTN